MQNPAETPLAIIGMACRVPGADDLESYWRLLIEGRTELGELPADRLDRSLYHHPEKGRRTKSYTTLGGVVPHRPFDFKRCPHPGELYDRGHKVHLNLCEVAAYACRHAGFDPFDMPRISTGVYVGHTPPSSIVSRLIHARLSKHTTQFLKRVPEFAGLLGGHSDEAIEEIVQTLRNEFPEDHPALRLNCNAYHGSGIIAQSMKLDGPCMSFDAACASSMRALAHAARALQLGQIDMAVVGAASYCHADTLILFSAAQSLTAKHSRPFDEEADGLIASEAYATILVKTLERAIADGDQIQAVVRGIGISSDGKGKSLWAPRREGQIEAVRRAYPSGLSPASLQYIEAHATSTQLGDATELGALHTALGDQLPAGKKLIVGSVKGNIGHSLETAGLASIVKTVLAMQRSQIPPQCGLVNLNADVEWDNVPFVIPKQAMPWPAPLPGDPKRAAVNAFGIGGLNVHVILEEPTRASCQSLVKSHGGGRVDVAANGPLPQREGIAIVGMGTVLPGVRTIDALWERLRAGDDQRTDALDDRWAGGGPDRGVGTGEHWKTPIRTGGFINDFEYDWKKHKVPPRQVQFADPLQFMLLDATDQALKNAGYDEKTFDRTRTGVVVGTIFGGEFADQLQMGLRLPEFQKTLRQVLSARGIEAKDAEVVAQKFEVELLKQMPALVDETGSFTASTLASRLTKTFDLMGGAVAVDAGDVSASAALSNCVDLLLAGDCDMMICASGQRNMGYAWFLSMNGNGMLSQEKPTAPFDSRSTGGVPGEGVGVVVLKRLSDAVRDGDRIHGVIRGIGASNGGPTEDCMKKAIQRALQSAQLNPDQVAVLEACSSGVPADDLKEWDAIQATYDTKTRRQPLHVGSVAGQFGHHGGASGMIELMKGVSELNHVEMPRNVGLEQSAPHATDSNAALTLTRDIIPLKGLNADGRMYAAINTYSTCNGAYHLLLEGAVRVEAEATTELPSAARETRAVAIAPNTKKSSTSAQRSFALSSDAAALRLVRIGAAVQNGLMTKASAIASSPDAAYRNGATLDDLVSHSAFDSSDRFRLAIVARSATELGELCALAVKQLAKPESRSALGEKGLFYGELSPIPRRVAFLFPGQGSQYGGMLKSLVEGFAPAAQAMANVDATLRKLNLPSFAEIAWGDTERLGTDVWITQLALLAADTISFEAARALGLSAERVAGHSFGELAALAAASAWTFEDAVRATSGRCAAIEGCQNAKGALLSTTAPSDAADRICREVGRPNIGQRLFVSHYNAPDQTVVGGDPAAVASAAEKMAAAGYRTRILDVPAAFHTPLMEETRVPFGAALEQIPMQPPVIPLLSSVSKKYVADPADIRDNLVVQMTQPVPWVDVIERLHREGFNVLVEVGPKQVLTGLQRQILSGRDAAIVGMDHPKRDGVLQLMFARALVEVSGALDEHQSADSCSRSPSVIADSRSNAASDETRAKASEAPAATPAAAGSAQPSIEQAGECRVLRLSGDAYEMGRQHGIAEAESIRRVLRRYADLAGTRWDTTPNIESALANVDKVLTADVQDELRGIADGAGVSHAALVAHNLRLYLDVGAGGLHFAIRGSENAANGLVHGANEEIQRALCLRDCLDRHVQVRTPASGIPHVAFCVVGQVGTLNGINAAGVAVSTSALIDVSVPDDVPQILHTVLVRRLLAEADSVDSAISLLREHRTAGAWTVCLSHHASDRLCYVEFDGRELKVQPTAQQIIATNHRLMKTFAAAESTQKGGAPAHSRNRMERLRQLLGGERLGPVTAEAAQSALRDRFDLTRGREAQYPTLNTVRRVDNQISVVMQPGKDRIWVTGGPVANGHANDFQCLQLSQLLPSIPANGQQRDAGQTPSTSPAQTATNPSSISLADLAAAYSAAENASQSPDVCSRLVMRPVTAPLDSASRLPKTFGPVLIAGSNPAADAIRAKFVAAGVSVQVLPIDHQTEIDAITSEIDRLCGTTPPPVLLLTTALDPAARTVLGGSEWLNRRHAGVMGPFFAVQRWYQKISEAGALNTAQLVAATSMGGDFGLSGRIEAAENGALSGLVKGVEMEVKMTRGAPEFRGRIIDFSALASPDFIAESVLRELAFASDEQEVGYFGTQRVAVRPVPVPVSPTTSAPPKDAVFVVTGGARGVTAAVAKELGLQFGVKLHLVGASPRPEVPDAWRNLGEAELKDLKATIMKDALANGQKPADAWGRFEKTLEIDRTLREFADAGVRAVYHACDVGDRTALSALLDSIRNSDGPIQGVIHGAGFERACRFEKKQRDLVDRTIAAKVDGAANLMELTANDPVRWFAAFGSVAGRFGGVGQADYCVANEMLAKLVDWFRSQRPNCGVSVFHWHAWDDVGMAVRPESQHIRKMHNIKFMPAVEGTRHLLNELRAGLREPEVAITERAYCQQRYGASLQQAEAQARTDASATTPSRGFPLVDRVIENPAGGSLVTEIVLDPTADLFLAQHLFKGRPMMPVVASIEAMVEAAMQLAEPGESAVAIHDIDIVTGLRFLSDTPQVARVHASRETDGVHCALTSDLTNRRGQVLQKDRPYLRARVELNRTSLAFEPMEKLTTGEWNPVWYPESDTVIWHGQPLRRLQEMAVIDESAAAGHLVANDASELSGARRAAGWLTPAALLDSCLYACGVIFWYRHRGVVAIPNGIESVRFGVLPKAGERCTVVIRERGRQDATAMFDFTLYRSDGSVVCDVAGYRNVIVAEEPAHAR